MFFALAAGIGNYKIALYGVGIILIMILLLDFIRFGSARSGAFLLRFQLVPSDFDDGRLMDVFKKFLLSYHRMAVKSVKMGQYMEHSYIVRLKRGVNEQTLISHLTTIEGMDRITLIAEENEGEV